MNCKQFCSHILLFIVFLLGSQLSAISAFGQVKTPEQVQMQFHRAQTAWRNRTSILEAKVRIDQVLEDAPDHAEAWKLRAEVLIAMERYQDAQHDAKKATDLDPTDGEAFLILAEAARHNDDAVLASESLEKAATLSINAGAEFHIKLSRSAVLLGESELNMAESFARVALAKDPEYAEAYYQLARVFVLQKRNDAAATILIRGFNAELLDPVYIGFDSTMGVLKEYHSLREFFH